MHLSGLLLGLGTVRLQPTSANDLTSDQQAVSCGSAWNRTDYDPLARDRLSELGVAECHVAFGNRGGFAVILCVVAVATGLCGVAGIVRAGHDDKLTDNWKRREDDRLEYLGKQLAESTRMLHQLAHANNALPAERTRTIAG